jgi:hypothetical protein
MTQNVGLYLISAAPNALSCSTLPRAPFQCFFSGRFVQFIQCRARRFHGVTALRASTSQVCEIAASS